MTAGPTREALDPVRYLTNCSSGKMGYALAAAAVEMGAATTLISGPTALARPPGAMFVPITSANDLLREVKHHFKDCDGLIMAAAPSDYTARAPKAGKIKRSRASLELRLEPTPDILKAVASSRKQGQVLVGFALETDRPVENARRKLKDKQLDLVVLNQPGVDSGFDADTNRVTIIAPRRKPMAWPVASKREIAVKLLELVAAML